MAQDWRSPSSGLHKSQMETCSRRQESAQQSWQNCANHLTDLIVKACATTAEKPIIGKVVLQISECFQQYDIQAAGTIRYSPWSSAQLNHARSTTDIKAVPSA